MKTILTIVMLITLATAACAQFPEVPANSTQPKTISMDLKNAPLDQAFNQLFRDYWNGTYVLTPEAQLMAQQTRVNLTLKNAGFDEAVAALAVANGLVVSQAFIRKSSKDAQGRITDEIQMTFLVDIKNNAKRAAIPTGDVTSNENMVDLELNDVPVKEAILRLFKGTKRNCMVGKSVAQEPNNKQTVKLSLHGVTFDEALQAIVNAAGLVYRYDGGVYVIETQQQISLYLPVDVEPNPSTAETAKTDEKPLNIEVSDVSTRFIIESLFKGSGRKVVISSSVPDTVLPGRLSMKGVTFEQALRTITKVAGLTFRQEGEVYTIDVNNNPPVFQPGYQTPPSSADKSSVETENTKKKQKLVNLDLNNVPIRTAIESLFRGSGLTFVISSLVPDITIPNLQMKDVEFDQACETIAKATGLTFKREGEVYLFNVSKGTAALPGSLTPSASTPASGSGGSANGIDTTTDPLANLVSIQFSDTSVSQAMGKVDPGWAFTGGLGQRKIPGAAFYDFPKDMAAVILLLAAGLKPPSGEDKIVTEEFKGTIPSIAELFQKRTVKVPNLVADGKVSQSRRSMSILDYYMGNMPNTSRLGAPAYIGGYKPAGGKGDMLITILSYQTKGLYLLPNILSVAGQSYVVADTGNKISAQQLSSLPSPLLSMQIYDVTLDQALDQIQKAAELSVEKSGNTYIIHPDWPHPKTPATTAKPVKRPAK